MNLNVDINMLRDMLTELTGRLNAAAGHISRLPIFPGAEEYRNVLLWHAGNFLAMLGDAPDREAIRREYKGRALAIYDTIPLAVDERSAASAEGYSRIGLGL